MDSLQVAWLAGLYEGEGSVRLQRPNGRRARGSVQLTIGMTDRDVIEHVHRITGMGAIYLYRRGKREPTPKGNPRKDRYDWKVGRTDHVRALLEAMLPYLFARRRTHAQGILSVIQSHVRYCRNGLHKVPAGRCALCLAASQHRKSERQRLRRAA